MMGGDITVESKPGDGLDVHDPPAADRAERRSARDRGAGGARVHPIAEDAEEPLILVVDDDATVRELVVRHLERGGLRGGGGARRPGRASAGAGVAAGGGDARHHDARSRRLDGAGGDQGRSRAGRHPGRADVDRRPEEPRLRAGAADYLVKPVDRTKLVETLTGICGSTAGRVLLVDDDEVVRRNVRQALEPIGWKVTEAENGQVAVEALAAARPT